MYAKEYGQFHGALSLNTPEGAEPMWRHLEILLKLETV
jgi:hypothetical protein